MLVLEPLERARARGAKLLAEITGFGMSSDAHHITQPSPLGAARAMRAALLDAGAPVESVGYINAHGTGTLANDATEVEAIRAAQAAGAVSKRFAPEVLLMLVITLTRLDAPGSPEARDGTVPREVFRQALADAVTRLVS